MSRLCPKIQFPASGQTLLLILFVTWVLFLCQFNQSDKLKFRFTRPSPVSVPKSEKPAQNETWYNPWPLDPECAHYIVTMAPNHTFPPRALVSFPGSGNSWLRYLIQCATGYFTGSVFQDMQIFKAGMLGEMRMPYDGSTIVQKTHHDTVYNSSEEQVEAYLKLAEVLFEYRGVLVIRNPFAALLAYWNFLKSDSQTDVAPDKPDLHTAGWEHFVRSSSAKWASLIKTWIQRSPDLLLVLYEDLKADPIRELAKITRYLRQPPMDPQRIHCIRKHLEGPFHRRAKLCAQSSTRPGAVDLDLIVLGHVSDVNHFLTENKIPLNLNYSGSLLCL